MFFKVKKMEAEKTCSYRNMKVARWLNLTVFCVIIAASLAQDAQPPVSGSVVTDATIIVTTPTNTSIPAEEGTLPIEGAEGTEGTEGQRGEGQEGGGEGQGGEGQEGGGEGQGGEGKEGGGEGQGGEGQEAAEQEEEEEEEHEGGADYEIIKDHLENMIEQGLNVTLESLQSHLSDMNITGMNMTGINMTEMIAAEMSELEGEKKEGGGEMKGGEKDDGENQVHGSEGGEIVGGHVGTDLPLQSLAHDAYGDYQVDFPAQPQQSYRYAPSGPAPQPQPQPQPPPQTGINPTKVQNVQPVNIEGGQARLFDNQAGNSNPAILDSLSQPAPGMTASATFGIVVGTVILSWLILGPGLCLAWRWKERRQEKKKMLLQRPQLHGSVDEGIMEAMVMSELGQAGQRGKGVRRQREEDVEDALTRNRSELQSFPTTTTLESRVI